jgi:hypothetical protein
MRAVTLMNDGCCETIQDNETKREGCGKAKREGNT